MNTAAGRVHWASTLSGAQIQKQEAFHAVHVRHPKLDDVVRQMQMSLTPFSESNITMAVGPTGVGKSLFAKTVLKMMLEANVERMQQDASTIPVIYVEAYTNGESRHTFRQVYEDMLAALKEPALSKKVLLEEIDGKLQVRYDRHTSIATLRRVLEKALKHRRTEVCVIDEAYNLLKLAKDTAVMDTLKSLANTTGAKIVLVGSYDLFDLVDSHAQVARRTTIIHFDRYHHDCADDRRAFKAVVQALVAKWPCEERPNLPAISDELLEISLGCVGLLKSLLLDVTALQLRAGGRWDSHYLQRAAKANKLREIIRKEIEQGEAKVRDALYGQSLWDEAAIAKLSQRMGL
jgi:energy-coupling factor transporter ATP-binding protein EcfA2